MKDSHFLTNLRSEKKKKLGPRMPSIDSGDGRPVLLSGVGLRSEPGVKLPAEAGAKVDYRAQSGGVATMG